MKMLSPLLKLTLAIGQRQHQLLSFLMVFVLSLPQVGFSAEEPQGKRLTPTELLALAQKDEADFSDRNKSAADTFHLLQQSVEIYDKGGTLVLDSPFYEISEGLPIIKGGLDHFAIHPSRDEFAYEKVLDGVVRYRHVFHGLKVVKFVETAELVLLLDQSGMIHAMPSFFKKSYLFVAAVPIFKNIVDLKTLVKDPASLDLVHLRISQWSRGIVQNLKYDEARAEKIPAPDYFLKDGKIIARDLIIYSPEGKIYAIQDAQQVVETLLAKIKLFDVLLLNLGVQTIADKLVQQELEDQQATEAVKNTNLNEIVLAAMPRAVLGQISQKLNKWKNAQAHLESDMATVDELNNFLPKMSQSIDDFKKKLRIDGNSPGFKGFNARTELNALEHGQAKGDIGDLWMDVVKFSMKNSSGDLAQNFAQRSTNQLKASVPLLKKALKALAWVAIPGAVAYGVFPDAARWSVNLIDSIAQSPQFNQMLSAVKPDTLLDPRTRFATIASSSSWLAIVPLAFLMSWASPEVMYQTGRSMLALNPKSTRAAQLMHSAREIKKMELFKRIVLFGYRFWGTLSLSVWNHIGKITQNENFLIAAEKGLNPFKRGQYQAFFSTEEDTDTYAQMKGIHAEVIRKRIALSQATTLAIMVAAQKYQVDPASLALAIEKGRSKLASVTGNRLALEEMRLTIESMSKKLHSALALSQDVHFKMDVDEFVKAYEVTKSVAEEISKQGGVALRMQYFAWYTQDRAKALARVMARLGQNEYETLMNDTPTTFITRQVWSEFWTDHLVVAVYPQLYGTMANPEDHLMPDGSNKLAMDPRGDWTSLWTNPIHMVRVVNNTILHFFSSGAKLAMQRASQQVEFDPRFGPIEKIQNEVIPRYDNLSAGTKNWTWALVDTRKSDMGTRMKLWFIKKWMTIQSDLIMTVGSKMLLQGQSFGMAMKGWFVLLSTGAIAISQFWQYLQSANEYYGIAMKGNREKLQGFIIQLSQASRLKDVEKMRSTLQEVADLYKKEAPELWSQWTGGKDAPAAGFEELIRTADSEKLSTLTADAVGLLSKKAPIPTEPNKFIMNNSVWVVVFLTAYLSTQIHVNSSNSHYLTPFNLMKDFAMNTGFVYLFYKAFESDGWWGKVLDKIDDYKARRLAKKNGQLPDVEDQASQENKKPGFCQVVLKKITFRK